jgi:D-alanine transaminase
MSIAYLNGEFLQLSEARIPVLDRGFIFGDGVYEVIPVYSRWPFRLSEHLKRLQSSFDFIRLPNPKPIEEWRSLVHELIEHNEWRDQSIYLQVTRGAAPRDHAFPNGVSPTVFLMSAPLKTNSQELVEAGGCAITAVDNRWLRCDIKATSLLPNVLLRQLAVDSGCVETLLLREGYLTEGAASNVFIVQEGIVLGPPKSNLMLPGITYDVVVELARGHLIPCEIRSISEAEMRAADEIWMTSSTREVLAITRLDGQKVGSGQPGPVYRRMYALYQEYKSTVMRGGGV